MKGLFALLFIIFLTGLVPVLGLSVLQTPENINSSEGENVSIRCYIEANSSSLRILVIWLKNNLTTMCTESFNTSMHQSFNNGNFSIIATLHLTSIGPNHSGIYHCSVWVDIPRLETVYGNGTHLYIVNSSTIVTTPSPHLTMDTVTIWSLSGLGILLLIFCIAFVIHIYYKGHYRRDHKEIINCAALVPATVTCTEVTYSEVHVKRIRNDEG